MPEESQPAPNRSRCVFISFASEDIDLANRILGRLESGGIQCWIAHRDIGLAASYPAAISSALESSGAVLLLLTEHANRSPHVRREIEMAFNARTPILPVRMSGILPSRDLEYFLSTTQWLDAGAAFDDDEAARLSVVLQKLLDRERIDGAWDERRRRRRQMAMAAGAGVLAIAAALLVYYTLAPGRTSGAADAADGTVVTDPSEAGRNTGLSETPATGIAATSPATVRSTVNPKDGQTYVWVNPGQFTMGCSDGDPACDDDERPPHAVTIAGFWLARTEVTAGQYRRRGEARLPSRDAAGDDLPASGVTWAEARDYCSAVGGRLPTEAEWEYAARAGTTTRYYASLATAAWYEETSDGRAHPVGSKAPNAFGLHDMLGNVAEWVRDRYYNAYDDSGEEAEIVEPLAPNASAVARGGSWFSDARGVRVSRRMEMLPDAAEPIIGVRCAHDKL